ncbi:MAG TPA: GNAT family N-acetyltransferase [Candidatus Obscuribacterales bacterium]
MSESATREFFKTTSGVDLSIGVAGPDDLDQMEKDDLFRTEYFMLPGSDKKWREGGLEETIILSWIGAELVGRVRLIFDQMDVDMSYLDHETGNVDMGFLMDLLVRPEHRKDGIGTLLIRFCENLSRNEGKNNTGVRLLFDNTRPLSLYLRLGYQKTYMSLPDAVDLYKRLDEPVSELSASELEALASRVLSEARAFAENAGAGDTFPWPVKA